MEQSKLLKVLQIEYTSDIRQIYKAAKRYAKDVHPDQNPDKKHLWLEFEIAYDVIKRLSDAGLSFEHYTKTLENTPGRKKQEGGNTSGGTHRSKQNQQSQKSQQKRSQSAPKNPRRGADINIRVAATFDKIVYGCSLSIRIPDDSAKKFSPDQKLTIVVTPTPIWTNKDGSISQRSLNGVFNKKVIVYGGGKKGKDGGIPGDLIVNFEIDTTESQSIREAISEHFNLSNPYANFYRTNTHSTGPSTPLYEEPNSSGNSDKNTPKKKLINLIAISILAFMLINYVSGNVDKRNSWDASFQICFSAESINYQVLREEFYNYESPYAAAFYYDYFSKDIDTVDDIETIEEQLLRIQDSNYLGIRSYAQYLINSIKQDDLSVVKAMNGLRSECGQRDFAWSE